MGRRKMGRLKADSGVGMDWEAALAYAEGATYAGYDDWRLPNVKELQSIVDDSGDQRRLVHLYSPHTHLE